MSNDGADVGKSMYGWATDLFPICRSITGNGVRATLAYLGARVSGLTVHEVPTGTAAFDWVVPQEWNIAAGWIEDDAGCRIVDFNNSNLHVMGYSEPTDGWLTLEELQNHLFSLPEQPDAIPYITSYYRRRWGFCIAHNQRVKLQPGRYHARIDSTLTPGSLTYGELVIPGESDQEVFISTYVCHPSMGNNELSGPVVTLALARWLQSLPRHRFTYRIVFIPETIGSIVYLSRNLHHLQHHVVAGFNITCVGDDRCYSYLASRNGRTLADKVALHVLGHTDPAFHKYSFLERGSDERQYCAPGVDLPVATMMRSKYNEYPEYHTSLDDLSVISPVGLEGAYQAHRRAFSALELNGRFRVTVLGEPNLGKRGLYPTTSTKDTKARTRTLMNLLAYCDGEASLLDIAEVIGVPVWELVPLVRELVAQGVLVDCDDLLRFAQ